MNGKSFDKEARAEQARAFFKKGYNCCQAVALAYSDVIGLDDTTIATMTSGFGGGMSRLREVCGCVSAMAFVAGAVRPATEPANLEQRGANYDLVQKLAAKYKEANGSIVCRELLGLVPKGSDAKTPTESPMPSARTPEYYKKRPCPDLCACAAGILAEVLNDE